MVRQARIALAREGHSEKWDPLHAGILCALGWARWRRAPRSNRRFWNLWLLAAQATTAGASNRKIRFASIGTGIRGCDLLRSARKVPNGELVGTADLYDMHRKAGVEACGSDVPTTRDYRELLDRKDVDAVIVAVADFQHRRVVLDCVAAGKDVYCEKPMSHNVADGLAMVKAVQEGKRIFQAGSQRVSNIVYRKAAEIYESGRLGEVTLIEGHYRSQFSIRRVGLSNCAGCERGDN